MIYGFLTHPYSGLSRAGCILFGVLGALHAQQAGEKLLRFQDVELPYDAVVISNVSVAGETVECGLFIKPPRGFQPVTAFAAGSDWLSQMTISLVNRTNKTIVFGSISFRFLDTGDCTRERPCWGASVDFGQRPAIDAYDGRTGRPMKPEHPERPPLDWKPEQTIVIHVGDYMADIEQNLSNSVRVTDITKVNFSRAVFYFPDGMRWDLGRYGVPDRMYLGKFNELRPDYFPGRKGNNWPPGYDQ